MNKKARKVTVRHARHVVNSNLRLIVGDNEIPLEDKEDILYAKKTKVRNQKGS